MYVLTSLLKQFANWPLAVPRRMLRAAKGYLEAISAARQQDCIASGGPIESERHATHGHGMEKFRISWVGGYTPMLIVADLLSMENIEPSNAPNTYMDVGWPYWFEEETAYLSKWPFVLKDDSSFVGRGHRVRLFR